MEEILPADAEARPKKRGAALPLRHLTAVDEVAVDSLLPSARAGLDFGPVVPSDGDYFGNPVNVAARLISVAEPASVVASRSFADAPVDRAAVVGELGGFGPQRCGTCGCGQPHAITPPE